MVIYPILSLWCPVGSGFSPPVGHLPVLRPSHDLNHFPAATDQALPPSKNQHLSVLLWSHIPTPWFAVSVFQSSACCHVCLLSKHIPILLCVCHHHLILPPCTPSLGLDVQLYTALCCLVNGWICTQYWMVDGSLIFADLEQEGQLPKLHLAVTSSSNWESLTSVLFPLQAVFPRASSLYAKLG